MRLHCPGIRTVQLVALLLFATPSFAQYELAEIPFFDSPDGTMGLGAGVRLYNDLYIGTEKGNLLNTDLVPLYLYNGKYLFSRGTAGGLHFFRNEHVEFNALLRWRTERLDPVTREALASLNERKQSVDGGLELRLRGAWGQLNLNYLTDTLDRHNGQSAEITYFHPFDNGKASVSPFIGWAWYSDDLANYYYGVSEQEATDLLPAYTPGEAQWLSLGVNTTYRLGPRWELFANVGVGRVDSGVANSPIVDTDMRPVLFAGFNASMGNLVDTSEQLPPERKGEWSWRINYGFQADGNLISDIDQGDFASSQYARTNIGGVTFARLFRETRRADYHAKFAVYRHFESDEGNGNFYSYAAYLTVTGKGYQEWSDREMFRYSFGYGLSYANRLPIDEEREQRADGQLETAQFLNYLELQLDFPLRNLFKRKNALEGCYAGLTVTHRSGIWGIVDLFSNVDGGSNWITMHFECKVGGRH